MDLWGIWTLRVSHNATVLELVFSIEYNGQGGSKLFEKNRILNRVILKKVSVNI